MAATNVFQNVDSVSVGGTAVTSVLEIRVDDNTQVLQDGSDNDGSFTFSAIQPYQCRVTLRFRDGVEAHKCRGKENVSLTANVVAAQGSAKTLTVANVSLTQPSESGAWGALREWQVTGSGGSYTLS